MLPYRRIIAWLLLCLFLAATGCQRTYNLTVLGTNDHHGHYWRNQYGEYGLAARMAVINNIRAEVAQQGGQVLLLDAGDINTGPPESTLADARPDIIGMNLLAYDAMVVGNHEFDRPFATLKKQESLADFPFLSANIFHARNGEAAFTPYIIKDMKGLDVSIIGLTTPDTPALTAYQYTGELVFKDPIKIAQALLPKLKKKADIVIGLTHLGYYPDGQHGHNAPGDVTLARSTKGIDYIVGGHTHDALAQAHRVDKTLISQAGEWGKFISRADFLIENGRVSLQSFRLIPINLRPEKSAAASTGSAPLQTGASSEAPVETTDNKTAAQAQNDKIAEDPLMLTLLSPYRQMVAEQLSKPIGRVDARLEGDRIQVRNRETSLGNLIAEAMRAVVQADLAIINSGAIRDSLEAGDVTLRDILNIHPFGNTICVVDLTGAELKNYLAQVCAIKPGDGSFPQTAGLTATLLNDKFQKLVAGKRPVQFGEMDQATYKLAVNNFIARGGDGYPDLATHPSFLDTGLTIDQALTRLFAAQPVVSVEQYRPRHKIKRLAPARKGPAGLPEDVIQHKR